MNWLKRLKPAREVEPWIWGAWGGIFGGVVGAFAGLYHQLPGSQTSFSFAMGGLFWGWVVGNIWNRLGRRKPY